MLVANLILFFLFIGGAVAQPMKGEDIVAHSGERPHSFSMAK